MKQKLITVLIAITSVFTAVLLLAALLLGTLYFTFSSENDFIDGVCSNIDIELIEHEIKLQMDSCSEIYGFDKDIPKKILDEIDVKELTYTYFSDCYTAFINGTEIPSLTLDSEKFYAAITENTDKSTRPEVYELDENRRALADKYALCITLPISSLSFDLVKNAAASAGNAYNEFLKIGGLFLPCAILFAVFFIASTLLIIIFKRRKSAYFASLTYFIVSLLAAVPFAYLAKADLPARFNVKIGASFAYLDAIYKYVFYSCSQSLIIISVALFAVFILAVIWNALKKKEANL